MSTRPKPTTPLSDPTDSDDGFLPTGSLSLDLALGGGWPRGRIVEVFGASGGGKTTLLLSAIVQAQRAGGMGALIDADHSVNRATAARLGIDLDRMPYDRTNQAEEAFARIEELAKSGSVAVIALDSAAALLPSEPGEHYQDQTFQYNFDVFLRALLGPLSRSGTVLLVSNQVREKVGVIFGSPETIPWATQPIREYASVRLKLERIGHRRDRETITGTECRGKVVKHRLAQPFQQAEFVIGSAGGIDVGDELLRLGLEKGVLHKRGAHLYEGDRHLGHGSQPVIRLLEEDAELAQRVKTAILERSTG